MIQLDNLITSLRLEIYKDENNFTLEQKKELDSILDSIQYDKIPEVNGMGTIKNPVQIFKFMSSMKKVSKKLRNFENKWVEFGGDIEKLKPIAKHTEDMMTGMIKSMAGI